MPDEPAAVAIHLGRFRLVLGSDTGITAMEVVVDGDQTRLDSSALFGTARHLQMVQDGPASVEAIFVIADSNGVAADPSIEDVTVSSHGLDDSDLACRVREVEPDVLKCVLVEAAFAAWRQRLADAADSLDELTRAEAEVVGQLDVPGRPLLTELRAERRRNLNLGKIVQVPDYESVVDRLVEDLRAAVRYGAAGLAAASDEIVGDSVHLACDRGGWVERLRLLIAAEEVRATELLCVVGGRLLDDSLHAATSVDANQLLAEYVAHRRQSEDLATLLDDACRRLPATPSNPAKRLIKRKEQEKVGRVRKTAEAYSAAVMDSGSPGGDGTTWDEAANALFELDAAAGSDIGFDPPPSQSTEEAAAALGDLFAQKLPLARTLVEDLARQHPGVDYEGRVQIVKRQVVQKLVQASHSDNDGPSVAETVAELAMAIALLRGIEPHTESEFHALGLRILARAERIAALHRQAGAAVPHALAGFEWFARYVQPVVVEFVFHTMAGAKPERPGAARDAYKFLRSRVWRARHDRGVAGAAAGGASAALLKAMDTAAPRLIVQYVDRSLPAPKC